MPHALQFYETGDYKEVLKYEEIEKPKISNERDVLIRVYASSVNPSDLSVVSGSFPDPKPGRPYPRQPGLEGAGVVEEIGSAVTTVKVGQRVHFAKYGTWSDYVVVDSTVNALVPIPDSISFAEACQMSVNPLTTGQLVQDLNIQSNSDEYLLQSGAGSANGRYMIQYAKAKGFKTINIVRRQEQVEELKVLGADHVINCTTESIIDRVKEITNGAGVKYAIECVGGEIGTAVFNSLGKGGILISYGFLTGEPIAVDPFALIAKGVVVKGYWLTNGAWRFETGDNLSMHHAEIIQLLARKQVTLASKQFAAKDFVAAFEHSKLPGKSDKTVLLFSQH